MLGPRRATLSTVPAPQNPRIARVLSEIAELLQAQHANPHRVRAYTHASEVISGHDVPLGDVYRGEGVAGLEAMPGIGYRLARAVVEILRTGSSSTLERLQGETQHETELAELPGIGEVLAERIHHELGISTREALRAALDDDRLAAVEGVGPHRLDALRKALGQPGESAPRPSPPPPSVADLLEVDRIYRARVAAGAVNKIAPKRNNPESKAWLPILHFERREWAYTALFSNTELAHELHKTDDWVVLHFEHDHTHGQATIVTEWRGNLAGSRVVRGRETACAAYYREHPRPPQPQLSWGDSWER